MIRLHHVPFSRSFRTLWLLHELGQSFDLCRYKISDGSLRSPEFMKVSPLGRVPALEIDGTVWFESPAITELLCERFPDAELAPAPGTPERAMFLQWLSFAETQASTIAALNLQVVFLRPPAEPSPVVVKLDLARLRSSMTPLEEVLGQQDWLLSSGFSAADTMLGFNLFAAYYYVDLEPFPNIRAYMARIKARAAYIRARAEDGAHEFLKVPIYATSDGPNPDRPNSDDLDQGRAAEDI